MRKVVLIGASDKPDRYAYKAAHQLVNHGYELIPIGIKNGEVAGVPIKTEKILLENIDTVTLYIGPQHQEAYAPYIINLKPKRVVFNPGTENDSLAQLLERKGIEAVEACTLVLLATNQF